MEFVPYSFAHGLGIAMAVLIIILILCFRNKLKEPVNSRRFRLGLVVILVGCELSLQAWYAITDNFGLHSLPFQLCSIMMWLSAALLITRNRRLYDITFFLGIIGALQAILTPNLDATFPEYRYFHFFVAHGAIISASIFLTVIDGYRPGVSSVFKAIGWLHILAIPAVIANSLTGSNFMFLARKPDTASLLDVLAPWPWYLLQLELVVLILCFMLLGIVRGIDRLLRKKVNISDV